MPTKTSTATQPDDIVAVKQDSSVNGSTTTSEATSAKSSTTATSKTSDASAVKRKIRKKVKKIRDKTGEDDSTEANQPPSFTSNLGADVFTTLTSSKTYLAFILLRFLLIFITPASLEGTEFSEGVDVLASALLPGINSRGIDPAINIPPPGLSFDEGANRTRSIVGAFVTSGIPFMGINVFCTKVVGCNYNHIAYFALYLPRIWMFLISLVTDYFLARCFAVYEGSNAVFALLTYASSWSTLIVMPRNVGFSLETMCMTGLLAACFGWKPNTPRPVFWITSFCLSLGVFLRPSFAFFIFTPIIYVSSLIGKRGIDYLRYVRAFIEGLAIFGFWVSIWVSVDSVYYGTFKLRFGEITMTSFDMFMEYCTKGLPFSYKGSLVYSPINAARSVLNRNFITSITQNTSPGQMFLSLPLLLGPLFIVLLKESYEGMKVALKELMSELQTAANSGSGPGGKKSKKKKSKKGSGMTKELEDELYVYFDTIQTSFLLGLLLEVVQNDERVGTLSLLSMVPPCILCIAGRVFGPAAFPKFKTLHYIFTGLMVVYYGMLNQSGIPRLLMKVGNDPKANIIPMNSNLVVYRGIIGHRYLLGPNHKNVSVHFGGTKYQDLLTKVRDVKNLPDSNSTKVFVLSAATEKLKDTDWEYIGTGAYGHMGIESLPNNIDDAVRKNRLVVHRFVGDENEAILRDIEESADNEDGLNNEDLLGDKNKQKAKTKDEL